jgi:Domain of Unknown Function (DUF1080)
MKNGFLLLLLIPGMAVLGFIRTAPAKDDWTILFNGRDLQGWDSYLGPPLDSSGNKLSELPVGLNNDPRQVFTVLKQDGEPVIRISGDGFGAISTKEEYDNFHLQLKFKWGSLTWGRKKNKKKDSGLLYFSVGEQGADNGAWMRSQEFQIEEGNCGEYWGCAGGAEDIPAIRKSDSEYIYQPGAPPITFSAISKAGRHCRKALDGENPSGEWNLVDLYCVNGNSVHVMNGRVMMVLTNSRQVDNGQLKPLIRGKLQIQSEGAEVFYKDIKIMPIKEIPPALQR